MANGFFPTPKDKAAIPALIGALKDKELHVRSEAVKTLGRFGPLAKNALPYLIEADDGGLSLSLTVQAQ